MTSSAVLELAPVGAIAPDLPPTPTDTDRGSDYAVLSRRIAAAGLMKRRPLDYVLRSAVAVALFGLGWAAFAAVGASWWTLAIAAFLGFATTQLAFLGHDIAHRQVFRRRTASEVAGLLLGNLGVGMSLGWWVAKHTRHHANPNHEDHDPDVGTGALVWTMKQAAGRNTALTRWLTRRQGTLFFPLTLLEGLNLHVVGAKEIATTPMRHRRWEAALMIMHFALYLTAVFLVLPFGMGLAFIIVHQAIFGLYMGASFAPNHKGMPVLTADDELDYLRKQVLTSRNVTGGRSVDFLLGGLNYQIEHHLFPNMPRAHLRRAQPMVRDFCAEIGVPYLETGLLTSYRQAVSYLNEVGAAA
jgi:fatty acid desaturase